MTTDSQQPSESGVSDVLRELSGIDDAEARSIVDVWKEWQVTEVIDTIAELRRAAETDRSLEFDSLFRVATSFPAPEVRLESVRALSEGGSFKIAQSLIAVLERDEVSEIRNRRRAIPPCFLRTGPVAQRLKKRFIPYRDIIAQRYTR